MAIGAPEIAVTPGTGCPLPAAAVSSLGMKAQRLAANPIITPDTPGAGSAGQNINGPSLIRVPDWLPGALGRYYLYFAHHQGLWIRLAYADRLEGPWRVHEPGTLTLEQASPYFIGHIASPDVHVDHAQRRIRMYVHGPIPKEQRPTGPTLADRYYVQQTILTTSADGLNFTPAPGAQYLANSYLRMFEYGGWHYGVSMPGIMHRSRNGIDGFERGPMLLGSEQLFDPQVKQDLTLRARHFALRVVGARGEDASDSPGVLQLFFSRAGDCPERIMVSQVELGGDWMSWRASEPVTLLEPVEPWEGAELPLTASRGGAIHQPARQLRDPAIFEEDGQTYLLYSIAGEAGIAIARIEDV